ncbi:3-hydroxyisobutyrate dehydrogenase [Segniliparus rotundus DSM 44985]|uniref:3-hydroxyisobutyrate dehydrogenase n=1 Tax=Segniliparus rotundus (strain ATCC BAA-972 / CDC 1076 / CIP 108378 / DSM 44985 / JCM 13578) TaxID=640132 RepID=D6ZD90_SEGRD|nr:3-hydroxyisobutyrate dehydrogenase [Segniliparus rotundus]ADG97154.1 3-hydroxyisobutyrate dehydrogenase [Segniliparus rotundus DSM 44985]
MSTAVAFIGLGQMGGPMSANLVKAGFDVVGYDLSPDALRQAEKAGVAIAPDIPTAVAGAEFVVSMLPTGQHVLDVYADPAFFTATRPDTLFIDSSTIAVDQARQAAELAQAAGRAAIDAPVSGGVFGAQNATLTFMAGGDEADVARAKGLLEGMGKRVVHCGGHGSGQAAKICNNMALGISMVSICEAFVLAEKLGLDPQVFYEVASTSSAQCWALTTNCPIPGPVPASPANRDYQGGFATALIAKDLALAADAADSVGTATEFGRLAAQYFRQHADNGSGKLDFSSLLLALREQAKSAT